VVSPSRLQTLIDLRRAFDAAGIEFIGTPEDDPNFADTLGIDRTSDGSTVYHILV
jgi:hypothetical protein